MKKLFMDFEEYILYIGKWRERDIWSKHQHGKVCEMSHEHNNVVRRNTIKHVGKGIQFLDDLY